MKKQRPKPDFPKWQKWQKNLERINDELLLIDHSRKIFLKVWDVINQNSELKKHSKGLYLRWLIHNYCVKLGMGIRRLIDERSNALNIYKLLKDIEENIQQINVDNLAEYFALSKKTSKYYKCYKTDCDVWALRAYKKAFGRHRKKLLLSDLEKDIKLVDVIKGKIEKYVNENWAHMGKKKVDVPNVKEAHDHLDTLIKIYTRYSLLISGREFNPYPKDILTDWDEPLRILWVQ
jgi:hypothetical protein